MRADLLQTRPGGLVFKAHRLLYQSTLGLRVIKQNKRLRVDLPQTRPGGPPTLSPPPRASSSSHYGTDKTVKASGSGEGERVDLPQTRPGGPARPRVAPAPAVPPAVWFGLVCLFGFGLFRFVCLGLVCLGLGFGVWGSEAGSYLRLIDFVYHSTLGLRVIKKKRRYILAARGVLFLGLAPQGDESLARRRFDHSLLLITSPI